MQISNHKNNYINFKRIQLSNADEKKVLKKLSTLSKSSSVDKIHSIKIDLFEIFDSHFQNELSHYSRLYTHKDDFLQGIYLRFFELLGDIQEKTVSIFDFMENINRIIKPNIDEKREREYSLDNAVFRDSEKTFIEKLTYEKLPVYASSKNEEENKIFKNKLEKISKDTALTKKEKTILELKKQGKNFEEIAKITNRARPNIGFAYLSAIAKIQKQNDILPEYYENYAKMLLDKYHINFSKEKIIDVLIKKPLFLTYIKNNELNNISEKAIILGCKEEEFIEMGLDQPSLFYINPQILKKNLSELIKFLEIEEEKTLQLVKKLPSLLYQNPERIKENITNSSMILNVEKKDFIHAVLKQPSLAAMKPETIKEKMVKLANFLSLKEVEVIEIALKDTHLFILDIETIKRNINDCTKIFGITKKEFIKAALKAPNLFYQKPETLKQNITQSAQNFDINENKFIKTALNAPCLFYQKPETLKQNIIESSNIFRINEKDFIKIALTLPSLFYSKPESLKQKVQEMSKVLGIDESEFIRISLIQHRLLCLNPESLKKNIQIIAESLNITEQEFVKEALKRPSLLCFRPENVNNKISKYNFYTKVTGKELENFAQIIRNKTDEFFERSFFFLTKKDLGNKKNITKTNFVDIIKKHPNKTFTFDLPQDECTVEFIQYVKDFFAKNIGTKNYKFLMDGKEVI